MSLNPKISVLIPVYREPKLLKEIVKRLIKDSYREKEIIVIFDGPCLEEKEIIERFRRRVRFIINKKNKGKVYSLNKAAKISSGDILVFLDNDVLVPQSQFLEKLAAEMKKTDILDIKKKVIKNSFLAKMMFYEYASWNVGAWILSKIARGYPMLNGSAWAIWKNKFLSLGGFAKEITEDLDIATRAFLKGYRFKLSDQVEVYNKIDPRWKDWFHQRRRWTVGMAWWFKKWYRELGRSFVRTPQFSIIIFLFLFPSLVFLTLLICLPSSLISRALEVTIFPLVTKFGLAIPTIFSIFSEVAILKFFIIIAISFLSYVVLLFSLFRKIGFKIAITELFAYYFFYSPLLMVMILSGFMIVFLWGKKINFNWKI